MRTLLPSRGLELVRPTDAEREDVNRIIMEELVRGEFRPESLAYLRKLIQRFGDDGCDAVVLGCTEIPLIINDAVSPLPTLDSTRLLAAAAVRGAIDGASTAPPKATGREPSAVRAG